MAVFRVLHRPVESAAEVPFSLSHKGNVLTGSRILLAHAVHPFAQGILLLQKLRK